MIGKIKPISSHRQACGFSLVCFITQGNDINDLMSMQAVKKIVELVKSGNYMYLVP